MGMGRASIAVRVHVLIGDIPVLYHAPFVLNRVLGQVLEGYSIVFYDVLPKIRVITSTQTKDKTMNLTTTICAIAALSSTVTLALAEEYQTGMMDLTILDADGDRHLEGFVWYPTQETDGQTRAHGNMVWQSINVIPNATPVEGQKPLLVLSHGMFGNARNQAWLAEAMTRQGYLVAAIDHPGTSTFQRDPDHRRELWERPRDISRTIDYVIASSEFGAMVDPDRIYMAGHSLGGFTALALAGGRYDPARVDADCAENPDELICRIFNDWDVAKTQADRAAMSADLSDPRIAGFGVFDLGGTQTFAPDSLRAIDTPMYVIGAPMDIEGLDLDRESRALAALLPKETVQYSEPESLAHFDFLGVCTEQALDILKEEEPDDVFVCQDGTQERQAEHQMIAQDITAFFAGL